MDFYICALSFGQNAIGQRQRIGATVSVYLNGTFVLCVLLIGFSPLGTYEEAPCAYLSSCLLLRLQEEAPRLLLSCQHGHIPILLAPESNLTWDCRHL